MTKKYCYVLHCLCLSLALCLACGNVKTGHTQTARKLVVALPPDSPPTYYRDPRSGQAAGFAVDVMNVLARQSGYEVEYIFSRSWDELPGLLQSGKADVVPSVPVSAERAKLFRFTIPMDVMPINLIARNQGQTINAVVPGMKIGIMQGGAAYSYFKQRSDITLEQYQSLQQLLMDLLAGHVDLIATTTPNLKKLAEEAGVTNRIRVVEPPLLEVKRAIAVRPGNEELAISLNKAVDRVVASAEYRNIYQKWWGKPKPYWTEKRIALAMGALLLATLIAMAALHYRGITAMNRQLRRSEEKYRQLFDTAGDAIMIVTMQGTILAANKTACRNLGYDENDFAGMTIHMLNTEEYVPLVDGRLNFAHREGHNRYETAHQRKDGSRIPLDVNSWRVTWDNEPAIMIICRDITERRQMEDELHKQAVSLEEEVAERQLAQESLQEQAAMLEEEIAERIVVQEALQEQNILLEQEMDERREVEEELLRSKEYTENIIQSANVIIVTIDTDGAIILLNRAAEEAIGYSRQEWREMNFQSLVPLESQLNFHTELDHLVSGGRVESFEGVIVGKYGARRTVSWRNSRIVENGAVTGIILFGIDITDHRLLEEKLLQSQKMESIGRLAGGIAHDFNNMLTPIIGYAEMLDWDVSPNSALSQKIGRIREAADKAKNLVQQLMGFSRKQILTMGVVNLNRVVEEFYEILRRTIRESIDIRLTLSDNEDCIRADRNQLEQIIMNLAINAQDAIGDDNGVITIGTDRVIIDAEYARIFEDLRPGCYALLTVTDTGCGMSREVVGQIFEPFFTTKDVGKGSGLGLSMVHGLVKQHKAGMEVDSIPGKGSTFKMYFPTVDGTPIEVVVPMPAPMDIKAADRTILLVEDNEMVRGMAKELLLDYDFTVLEAEDPKHALQLLEGRHIDLLITDVVMPGMSGPELHRQLQKTRPGLQALFMSGYVNDSIVAHQDTLDEGINFIQKPFTAHNLMMKVINILN